MHRDIVLTALVLLASNIYLRGIAGIPSADLASVERQSSSEHESVTGSVELEDLGVKFVLVHQPDEPLVSNRVNATTSTLSVAPILYSDDSNSSCPEGCHASCEKGCTGCGHHLGLGGCNSCKTATIAKRGSSATLADGSKVRVTHWCMESDENNCEAGHFAIEGRGRIASDRICAPCVQESCFACEDITSCLICEYARKIHKPSSALLERIAAGATPKSLVDYVDLSPPVDGLRLAEENGQCVTACEHGTWLHRAPRMLQSAVKELNETERQLWYCRAKSNFTLVKSSTPAPEGEEPAVPVEGEITALPLVEDAECRREDDLCLPCDESCGAAGCTGAGPDQCLTCKYARLYLDEENTKYKCVTHCPEEMPFAARNEALGQNVCSKTIPTELEAQFKAVDADADGSLSLEEALRLFKTLQCPAGALKESVIPTVLVDARQRRR